MLEEFANTMALRTGGLNGIQKLIDSKAIGTIELSTGIRISGVFDTVLKADNRPIYFQTKTETALSYRDKELVGHGIKNHPKGFGSPIGKLKGINLAIEDMSPRDLNAYNIYEGKVVTLEFENNLIVHGEIITGKRNLQGKIILISFKNCTVSHFDTVLFCPEYGLFDMAVGKSIVSAFSGPADYNSFNLITHKQTHQTIKSKKTKEDFDLELLYQDIRNYREGKNKTVSLPKVLELLEKKHTSDWLLSIELYELAYKNKDEKLKESVLKHLEDVKQKRPQVKQLIKGGLQIIDRSL